MHGVRQRIAATMLSVLLVVAAVAAVSGAAAATPDPPVRQASIASAAQITSDDSINQTQTYALTPSRPDDVTVTLTYEIPDRVVSLETRIPAGAIVTTVDGFDPINDTAFEWDTQSNVATIRYRIDPTQRIETTGPESADGEYLTADAGEWALVQRSRTPTTWTYTGQELMQFRRDVTTAGPGAAGDTLVYLGDAEIHERTANEQRFRLAVPESATMAEDPSAVLDSLTNASNGLRVGDRDESVFVVAAPTDGVEWGVRGLQVGPSDMWVRDSERLDTADNVWIHEYVHTRQSFRTTEDTRWVIEGSATYYAAVLALEQDRINFTAFRDRLDNGSDPAYDDVVLSDPDSWTRNANYHKGPLVAGRIDEQIRVTTDSERTLQDAVRILNGDRQQVTQARFLSALEEAGGPSARQTGSELTGTEGTVEMWNQSVHARVFGQLPARIGYRLPSGGEDAGYRVSGPYRTTDVNGSRPIQLATGENLTIDAVVRNAGGTEGRYNATLAINGTEVATKTGRLEPGERRVVPLSHTFVTQGRYAVSIDGENVTVYVSRPARARVSSVRVDRNSAIQGDSVVVTATVVNDANIPAEGSVVFTKDFQTVAERQVYLPPQNSTRISNAVTLSETGRVLLSAGGASSVQVTVTLATETPTRTPMPTPTRTATRTATPTTGDSGPGFTVTAVVLALLVTSLLARRRRSRRS